MKQAAARTDPGALWTQAEAAFRDGRLPHAAALLARLRSITAPDPAVLHLSALVAKQERRLAEAEALFTQAVGLAPRDPELLGNWANLLGDLNRPAEALTAYGQALAARPGFVSALLNRAALLGRLGRHEEALTDLAEAEAAGARQAQLYSMRGAALLALGRLPLAADAYDQALARDPVRVKALAGRASIAMQRGEPHASQLLRQAVALSPDDPALRLQLAEALEAEGSQDSLGVLEAAVGRWPDWVEGQRAFARMRWEAGQGTAFTEALERRLTEAPDRPELWRALADALAWADQHAAAADAARRGCTAVGESHDLLAVEATQLSEAGDTERANAAFAKLRQFGPGERLAEARHRLRTGEFDRAQILVSEALRGDPWSVNGWALQGVLWRLADDSRSWWLHGQPGLYAAHRLPLDSAAIASIAECLRGLHRTRAHPLGQSLRGGTQTRGRLFDRLDPEVRRLRAAIETVLLEHWKALPRRDDTHPLLRHRDGLPALDGSWSVRLMDGGFHVAHIHPRGVISSACYLVAPASGRTEEGYLEVGGPPPELQLDLGPVASFAPVPGRMILFPSTMYHGTRSFPQGERLTAAFDVTVA